MYDGNNNEKSGVGVKERTGQKKTRKKRGKIDADNNFSETECQPILLCFFGAQVLVHPQRASRPDNVKGRVLLRRSL